MLPQGERPPAPDPDEGEPPVNVLIMGTDSRGAGDQGRSDVLMMAHLTGDRKTAYLISFPRDMWVDVPGHGMAKINAAYAWGGMPLTVQTVEQLTGTHVSHSAVVDFEGFVQAIDAVGGVEVYNHVASSAGDQYFPEGLSRRDLPLTRRTGRRVRLVVWSRRGRGGLLLPRAPTSCGLECR